MSGLIDCPDCDGHGWVTVNPSPGWPRNPQLDRDVRCLRCMGSGEIEPVECDECGALIDEGDDGLCERCDPGAPS